MTQDTHRQAVERFEEARDAMSDQYDQMRDDLRFSDPSNPKQWDDLAMKLRKGRPCLTFDHTNQYIGQVVNRARQQKPAIQAVPADSGADIAVAEAINGMVRHIEYVSRAGIAYDTALEYAARIGIGWLRVVPEVIFTDTNQQDIRIKRVTDPLSTYLEAGWQEPDGSDAMWGFIESELTQRAFKRRWPKASMTPWEGAGMGWLRDETVRICEYLEIKETKKNAIRISMEGQSVMVSEDEYWQLRQQTGMAIPAEPIETKERMVKWRIINGAEVLEETDFPSQYLPLIPVIGHEIWVDGERHLCGMTRRLKDAQRAYNYERSAGIEAVALQPKAPFTVPGGAIEGYEDEWAALNQGNPAYLPYNHRDDMGEIPAPSRMSPPAYPAAFAQGGMSARADMEAAIGMYRSNLGAPSQATSGRAKREDKEAGDTANYHYTDNLNRSVEQLGRVVIDMMPRVYDTSRQARILGEDGTQDAVQVDPEMQQAVRKQGKKVVAINLNVGTYDARVKAGPAYTTLREEQAEQLAHIMQNAPQTVPILADLWVGAQDMPDGDKAKRRLAMMLPPQIQQAESDDGEDIPPAAQAQIAQLTQQLQQMQQALQEASKAANVEQTKIQIAKDDREVEMNRLALEAVQARTEKIKIEAEAKEKIARAENYGAELQARIHESKATLAAEYIRAQSDVQRAKVEASRPEPDDGMSQAMQARIDGLEKLIMQMDKQEKPEKNDGEDGGKESDDMGVSMALSQVAQMVANLSAQVAQIAPKKSMFTIEKTGDGKYVGSKTEH